MNAAQKRTSVLVSSSARRSVAGYESTRRKVSGAGVAGASEDRRLTELERLELQLLWDGYGTAAGSYRSPMESVIKFALRAQPREHPVRKLVVEELERHSGHMPLERLVQIVSDEGMATRHEVRLAVRAMIGAGILTQDVQSVRERRDVVDSDGRDASRFVELPAPVVHLSDEEQRTGHGPRATREERWRRQDEELRLFCAGYIPCKDSSSGYQGDPSEGVDFYALPEVRMPKLIGRTREVLERVYGRAYHPAYVDVFGSREIAAVVEYTAALAEVVERMKKGTPRTPTPGEALRAVLDESPAKSPWQAKWQEERKRFIDRARSQGDKIIAEACKAYRAARRAQ